MSDDKRHWTDEELERIERRSDEIAECEVRITRFYEGFEVIWYDENLGGIGEGAL